MASKNSKFNASSATAEAFDFFRIWVYCCKWVFWKNRITQKFEFLEITFSYFYYYYKMDTISYLRKLSLKKLINYLKLLISYYISYLTKKPVHWGMPVTISIEPTNLCNLGCKECPTGMKTLKRPKGNMNLALLPRWGLPATFSSSAIL